MSQLVVANGGSVEVIGDGELQIISVTPGTPTEIVIEAGLPGPKGDPGDITPEQLAGIVNDYLQDNPISSGTVYDQLTPLATWSIPHGFGRRPNVAIYDSSGDEVIADVTATNTFVTIQFANPVSGQAVLS